MTSRWPKALIPTICLLIPSVPSSARAGALPELASVDADLSASVAASVVHGNTLYIGGRFDYVTRTRGAAAVFDPVTGDAAANFPRVKGTVYAVLPDGAGGYYLGGNFGRVDGLARSNLAHVLVDGSLDAWSPQVGGTVRALTLNAGVLYVGGEFLTAEGNARSRLAAYNVPAGTLRSWNPNADGVVRALASSGSTVYAGGAFTVVGGEARVGIAALRTSNGNATSWNPPAIPFSSEVRAVHLAGDTVYYGGGPSFHPKAVLTDGTVTPLDPSVTSVNAILRVGSTVYLGGGFKGVDGQTRNNLAAVDVLTGALTSWNPDAGAFIGDVQGLAAMNGAIVATGAFTTIGGQRRLRIAALDAGTGAPLPWDPRIDDSGYAVAVVPAGLVCGGSFIGVNHQSRRHLAAIDLATGEPTAWNPSPNKQVFEMELLEDSLFVGGEFDTIAAVRRRGLATFDAGGSLLPLNLQLNGAVTALGVEPARLLVGGGFTSFGGVPRTDLAALERGTGAVSSWQTVPVDGDIFALASDGTTVYVGGSYRHAGSDARAGLAAVSADDGALQPWNPDLGLVGVPPGVTVTVNDIELDGGRVYAGGYFNRASGQVRGNVVALDPVTAAPLGWNPDPVGPTYEILVDGDRIYLAGQGGPIVAVGPGSGSALPWSANAEGEFGLVVKCLKRVGTHLYIGGSFEAIDGVPHGNLGVAEVELPLVGISGGPNLGDPTARILVPAPHPVRGVSRLRFELSRAGTVRLDVVDLRGRRMRRLVDGEWRAAGPHEIVLDRAGLAPGVYFLSLRTEHDAARGRFAVLSQ